MNADPFALLGIDEEADDAAVRQAYLARVREFPPDRAPERFQAIRAAYEAVADSRSRLALRLFHPPAPDLAGLAAGLLVSGLPARPTARELLDLLAAALPDYRLPPVGKDQGGRDDRQG